MIRLSRTISFYLIILPIFIWSCESPANSDDPPPMPQKEPPVEVIVPTGTEKYLNTKSDYIFDQNKLPSFELTLPPAALARIDADPSAEEYVEGSLTFEGETISPVGIRYKGSIGAFVGCLSGNDWANPSGFKTCTKLSMKVKINWEGSDTKFYGLKKLQFHSQNLDNSKMRERLAYHLFRQMGVAAPRSVHAKLYINGTYSGLYALTEQIDGRLTRVNFEDGTGNLYKEIWPLTYTGMPQSELAYKNALKTNEDENPSVELIRSFAEEIAAANEEERKAVVNKWMDVDKIISYAVVDRTIRVDDGPFHWYCEGNSCSNHNFYWYEEPTEQKLYLIPWDMDNAFENIVFNSNPVTPIADGWGESQSNCQPFSFGTLGLRQRSAACDKLIAAWASFDTEYEQTKAQFIEGPFSESQVTPLLDAWAAQIRAAILEAIELHEDEVSISAWESAVNSMKFALSTARRR